MAESMFMYGVAAGLFAFLTGVVFAARGARGRHKTEGTAETHSGGSGDGKRIKKFKSDGTPVYD